jgi:16S rRNA (guanine966-N2)-methyltransferase
MTRVVAGVAGGRRLVVPDGEVTRPTSDRVREAMFSTLTSLLGSLDGLMVLDLYAGSGALGLEALSRGAAHCTFVEHDRRALAALRRNVASTGLDEVEILATDVGRALRDRSMGGASGQVDLVLADPPYALSADALVAVLRALLERGWLAGDAVLVVERPARETPPMWPDDLAVLSHRRYGETVLWYLRGPVEQALSAG